MMARAKRKTVTDVVTRRAEQIGTWEHVRAAAELFWPGLGGKVVDQMIDWDRELFDNSVPPSPVVLSRMSSIHGHWFPALDRACDQRRGFEGVGTFSTPHGYTPPSPLTRVRRADILRGMMVRYLETKGLDSRAGKADWNELVMRLHLTLTGQTLWAAEETQRYQTVTYQEPGKDPGLTRRLLVVEQSADPKTGNPSLPIELVKSWPFKSIDLGDFVKV